MIWKAWSVIQSTLSSGPKEIARLSARRRPSGTRNRIAHLSKRSVTITPEEQTSTNSMSEDAAHQQVLNTQEEKRQKLVNLAVADGRKLATFRIVSNLSPIPGADFIDVAQVEGWKVVVKKDEFQVGDLCVFFEVDAYLPAADHRYDFLEKTLRIWKGVPGYRLKTVRRLKQLSQGLALPVHLFPQFKETIDTYNPVTGSIKRPGMSGTSTFEEFPIRDMNLTGDLGIMKWEKPLTACQLASVKGAFPSFIAKSDQERCQNMGREIFQTGLRKYEVTLKMDGTSMTVFSTNARNDGTTTTIDYGVCSRNLELKIEDNEDALYIKEALPLMKELDMMGTFVNFAFQGELMGPNIQGNREALPSRVFFVFNVYDITVRKFVLPPERASIIEKFNAESQQYQMVSVPVLYECVTLKELGITNMDELIAFAIGPSLKNPIREGLVFKAVDGRHHFKVISNLYLEKEK